MKLYPYTFIYSMIYEVICIQSVYTINIWVHTVIQYQYYSKHVIVKAVLHRVLQPTGEVQAWVIQ